jgi:hypothetical protein
MKGQSQYKSRRSIGVAGLVMLLIAAAPIATMARNRNPRVLPPHSHAYGKTYGEWSAAWWNWAFSLPVDQNPFFDETGCEHGANGQSGPVWFLTGVINESGTAERTCTVPAGKALFFPLLNVNCGTLTGDGETEAELRACGEFFMGLVTDVFCEIDGVPVRNLQSYRTVSLLFTYGPLPDNNVLQLFGIDAPAGATSLSVADGFYLLLAPLRVGEHTLRFGGTFGDPINFTLDITYHITVVGRAR